MNKNKIQPRKLCKKNPVRSLSKLLTGKRKSSDEDDTVVRVPAVAKPIAVPVETIRVTAQIRHAPVATGATEKRPEEEVIVAIL